MLSIFGYRINLDWFHNHADRDIIRRWTVGEDGETRRHELVIEAPDPPEKEWCFLVLGDTGDSARFGSLISPQRAVATLMAQDCGLTPDTSSPDTPDAMSVDGAPPLEPAASLVLHTGDINYLTGEERLYDLNFIDPYRAFQTAESHFQNLTFRIPFLPVPGNHDYYDLHGWMGHIMKFGSWVGLSKLLTHFFYRLGLPVPFGGSEMGSVYMRAFVNQETDSAQPLPYRPGVSTKLPNRYYQFRRGNVHFFALDSNTLDTPPPGAEDTLKEHASAMVKRNEKKLDRLNAEVERDREWENTEVETQREAMRAGQREEMWPRFHELLRNVAQSAEVLSSSTQHWATQIEATQPAGAQQLKELSQQNSALHDRWNQVLSEASGAEQKVVAYEARLDDLINLQQAWLEHLVARDKVTVQLPGAPEYEAARQARLAVDAALGTWCRERVGKEYPGPCALPACEDDESVNEKEGTAELEATTDFDPLSQAGLEQADLGEAILDAQRDLALARKLSDRTPEDYDDAQIQWLRDALEAVKIEEAERQAADARARIWRVVYLHHPLYTTTPSHAERGDSIGVRNNLEEILKDADLVLAGHSHGFEWLHSRSAPNQCYMVTGAGGQSRLQGSIFSPQLAAQFQTTIASLNSAGLDNLVWASGEPSTSGATVEDKLFSYLRVRVSPDQLEVAPVGVRQQGGEEQRWERIHPMPVHEVDDTGAWQNAGAQPTRPRLLQRIVVRRGQAPVAEWAE
jgi:hypothetical protein